MDEEQPAKQSIGYGPFCPVCYLLVRSLEEKCPNCGVDIPDIIKPKKQEPETDSRPRSAPQEMGLDRRESLDRMISDFLAGRQDKTIREDDLLTACCDYIENALKASGPDNPDNKKCYAVYERAKVAKIAGDTVRALKFANTCIVMLKKNTPGSEKHEAPESVSPELRKLASEIDELQAKSMELGVNMLDSERARSAALESIKAREMGQALKLLEQSLASLKREIKPHVMHLLQVFQVETERAQGAGIETSRVDSLIKDARVFIASGEFANALSVASECRVIVSGLKTEYNKKTNTFECPVCGAMNTVDAHECTTCGTTFPELGPVFRGEKIKVAPPKRKNK